MNWTLPRFAPVRAGGATRLHELDGLRGWAALSVVLFHIFWETFGAVVPWFRNPLTQFLFDGRLAVSVFFVLSGEALSSGYFSGKGRRAVVLLAAKRYPRLAIPVLASCGIVAALMMNGLTFHLAAAEIVHRPDWMGGWLRWTATIPRWLDYSLAQVFLGERGQDAFIPFLWTMKLELLGSIVVFLLLLSLHHRRFGFVIVAALMAALLAAGGQGALVGCFLAGLCYAAARQHGVFQRLQDSRVALWVSSAGILAVAILDGFVWEVSKPLVAVALTGLVFANRPLCAFFANGVSRFLGRISFPIYLMQFPVLICFTAWAIVFAHAHGGLTLPTVLAIAAATLAACIVAAMAFEPVERFTAWVGRGIGALVSRMLQWRRPAPSALEQLP